MPILSMEVVAADPVAEVKFSVVTFPLVLKRSEVDAATPTKPPDRFSDARFAVVEATNAFPAPVPVRMEFNPAAVIPVPPFCTASDVVAWAEPFDRKRVPLFPPHFRLLPMKSDVVVAPVEEAFVAKKFEVVPFVVTLLVTVSLVAVKVLAKSEVEVPAVEVLFPMMALVKRAFVPVRTEAKKLVEVACVVVPSVAERNWSVLDASAVMPPVTY